MTKRLYSLFSRPPCGHGRKWIRISALAFPIKEARSRYHTAILSATLENWPERRIRPVQGPRLDSALFAESFPVFLSQHGSAPQALALAIAIAAVFWLTAFVIMFASYV